MQGATPTSEVRVGFQFTTALARFASEHPRGVVAAFAVVGCVAAVMALRIHDADDVLDFIPPDDPDVKVFREVSKTFGVLRVALVGIEAPAGHDVFTPETMGKIFAATEAVKSVKGVDSVMSLAAVNDFVAADDGVELAPLVRNPPKSAEEAAALRKKVMSRAHVVGNFVSPDGTAVLLLVYLADGAADRPTAHAIRKAVQGAIQSPSGPLRAVYGGLPFAASSIYEETQEDIRRLTPLAVLLILAVILVAFRDPVGVVLTIFTVVWAAVVVIGGMALLGEPYTAASSTLPVILFASGSSYAVHLLGRYYALGADEKPLAPGETRRILQAAQIVGPPVAVAGFTTAAGFFSFLVMDIRPMRAFGLECAIGVLLCLVASLLLVPAVITLLPRPKAPPASTGRLGAMLSSVSEFARANRVLLLVLAALLAVATVKPMLSVQVRMEPESFFSPGSEPWNAQHFLDDKFNGATFLHLDVRGDLTDPATLDEVQRFSQFAGSLAGVTQVQSIVQPLSLVNEAMGGGRRLPETRAQVQNLLFFLEGEPSVRRLLSPGRDRALVHIRIKGDSTRVLAAVEKYLASDLNRHPSAPTPAVIAERLRWIYSAAGRALSVADSDRAIAAFKPITDAAAISGTRAGLAEAVLRDAFVDDYKKLAPTHEGASTTPPNPDPIAARFARLRAAIVAGDQAAFMAAAPSPEEGRLAWSLLEERLHTVLRQLSLTPALRSLGPIPGAALAPVREALEALWPEHALVAAPRALDTALAGEPILNRGMSRSVGTNQEKSLAVSLIAVLILMALLFRSPWLAFVSVFPSALAMALVFGTMGLCHVRIDIGTSLVASICTGAGSDFAMHYLWYLRRATGDEAHDEVVRFVGPIMVISVLLIAAGFAVLGAGNSQPMRLFGALASLSMLTAALLTFLLVPALLRSVDQPLSRTSGPAPTKEKAA